MTDYMQDNMPDNMYDMFKQYLKENPEESKMWKKHVSDELGEMSMKHPGAPLTNEMLEKMIDGVISRSGMDKADMNSMSVDSMEGQPAAEVFAQGYSYGRPPRFHDRDRFDRDRFDRDRFHDRFHHRFFPRDFARFLLLSQLLG